MRSFGGFNRLAYLFFFGIALKRCAGQQQCYYPAGNVAPDVPCNQTGTHSACCNPDAFCLGNGLCYSNAVISRGSCTDQTFKDPSCPIYCTQWQTNQGSVLINCNAGTDAFICSGQSCSDQSSLFTMRDANTFVFNTSGSSVVEVSPRDVVNLSPGNSTGNSTGSSTGNTSQSASATGSKDSGTTYSAGALAGVGVGVGIPLLLALLGAIFVIWRQKKRLSALNARLGNAHAMNSPAAVQDYSKTAGGGYGSPQVYPHEPLLPSQPNTVVHSVGLPQYHSEMDGVTSINELSVLRERQELDTSK